MNGRKTLNDRNVKAILLENPTISSLDELCAVWGCVKDELEEEDAAYAQMMIDRNILRMKVLLKNSLYKQNTRASHETLFKLIGNDDDLKRFGINTKSSVTTIAPVIEIKSADPDILDKLKNL